MQLSLKTWSRLPSTWLATGKVCFTYISTAICRRASLRIAAYISAKTALTRVWCVCVILKTRPHWGFILRNCSHLHTHKMSICGSLGICVGYQRLKLAITPPGTSVIDFAALCAYICKSFLVFYKYIRRLFLKSVYTLGCSHNFFDVIAANI